MRPGCIAVFSETEVGGGLEVTYRYRRQDVVGDPRGEALYHMPLWVRSLLRFLPAAVVFIILVLESWATSGVEVRPTTT